MNYLLKIIIGVAVFCQISFLCQAQENNDSLIIDKMQQSILEKSTCYEDLRVLCKTIGHRLSGTAAAAKAVQWGKAALEKAGADKVYLQPVLVPHWVRGTEEFILQLPNGGTQKIPVLGLGNSVGTKPQGIIAQIIEVKSKEDIIALGKENVQGKIVFFNHPWNQHLANPFDEYGNSVYYRWAGPSLAAQFGAVACIIRSAGSGYDSYAHTGSMRYDSNYAKIPAMAISYNDANNLHTTLQKNTVQKAIVKSNSHFEKDVLSYNVIGEITGSVFPKEIITVGGHLDSWDVGEGAHDDGAGCVQSIEVIRAIKQNKIASKRTIRCVLFMNEENGLKGGTEYAKVAKEKNENHICAIETDAGGFSPRGFSMSTEKAVRAKVKTWSPLFYPIGVYSFEEEGGGADIGPLHKTFNTPIMELLPDPQRYFDLHHTQNDVFEQVNRRELSMGALALSTMVWLVSEYGL